MTTSPVDVMTGGNAHHNNTQKTGSLLMYNSNPFSVQDDSVQFEVILIFLIYLLPKGLHSKQIKRQRNI